MRLYLDIETIPSQSRVIREDIAKNILPPGNISKPETIAAWVKEKKPAAVDEAIAKTSFDGAAGHVCCIGWAVDEAIPQSIILDTERSEADVIEEFARSIDRDVFGARGAITIIGHNVVGFDIRFLWQRAIVLGVPMPMWFPRDPKPWGNECFDTMTAFAGQRGTISLDRLCIALGMDGKGEMDGSKVAGLWEAQEYEAISTYCKSDVERVRAIHKRMLLAFGEAA